MTPDPPGGQALAARVAQNVPAWFQQGDVDPTREAKRPGGGY
jgi:hypothetical protein